MLSEVDCNSFMRKILDWGYKIGDSTASIKNKTIKRPFDGFGVLDGIPLYWESKYLPEPAKRISHNKLFNRKHQAENLIEIYNNFEKKNSKVYCLFCLFMRFSYRKLKLFIASNYVLQNLYFSRKSINMEDDFEFSTILSTNLKHESLFLRDLITRR